MTAEPGPWAEGGAYERYMGRWSRVIAAEFIAWLAPSPVLNWADIGCGTGALTGAILGTAEPRSVRALDASGAFIAHAAGSTDDARAVFEAADAASLPLGSGTVDIAVSGLAYNFFPDRQAALGEMQRITRPGGTVAFYVWDYPTGGMGVMEAFWQAALIVDTGAAQRLETARFPFCTPETLARECMEAGLSEVQTTALTAVAEFESFEDFWGPFTAGTGPAPAYLVSRPADEQAAIEAMLRKRLAGRPPRFPLRAWAVRGRVAS